MTAFATPVQQQRAFPSCWGHRGASAELPENTIASFKQAVDVHVSKDRILVMFHDPSLDRTMDGVGNIKTTNYYGGLDQMRTREHPHQPMATFKETMDLLSQPEHSHVVLNLDIKPENDAETVFALMADVVHQYPGYETALAPRLILGLWHPKFIEPAKRLLPSCRRICISCSTTLARKYFWGHVEGFSIAFADLMAGDGPQFRKDCQQAGLKLYVWTVNDRDEMIEASKWQVEAILTDKCADFLELRNSMQADFDLVQRSRSTLYSFRKWYYWSICNRLYIWLEDWRLVQAGGPLQVVA